VLFGTVADALLAHEDGDSKLYLLYILGRLTLASRNLRGVPVEGAGRLVCSRLEELIADFAAGTREKAPRKSF